jgi:hypothetical protein
LNGEDGGFQNPAESAPSAQLANPRRECSNQIIETGVLHDVGLRDTLEPDPDNTGVGSFPILADISLESA